MTWIRVDHVFGQRAAIFSLSRWDAALLGVEGTLRGLDRGESALTADRLTDIILHLRPDLAGGVLEAIGYNQRTLSFEFTYSHASLPLITPGDTLQIIRLVLLQPTQPRAGRILSCLNQGDQA